MEKEDAIDVISLIDWCVNKPVSTAINHDTGVPLTEEELALEFPVKQFAFAMDDVQEQYVEQDWNVTVTIGGLLKMIHEFYASPITEEHRTYFGPFFEEKYTGGEMLGFTKYLDYLTGGKDNMNVIFTGFSMLDDASEGARRTLILDVEPAPTAYDVIRNVEWVMTELPSTAISVQTRAPLTEEDLKLTFAIKNIAFLLHADEDDEGEGEDLYEEQHWNLPELTVGDFLQKVYDFYQSTVDARHLVGAKVRLMYPDTDITKFNTYMDYARGGNSALKVFFEGFSKSDDEDRRVVIFGTTDADDVE